jgi:hypothetical protein
MDATRTKPILYKRITVSLFLAFTAAGLAAFGFPIKPNIPDKQFNLGFEAGRRAERADLCQRFEKHSTVATGLLGDARMATIRAFCAVAR